MQLNAKYKLDDLTITNAPYPNTPTDSELKNIKWLADTLLELEHDIGPFQLISAFRCGIVQNWVKGFPLDLLPPKRSKSFHEAGMAADIFPTTMTIQDYFGKILASEKWKSKLGEIALKPSQNTLHISLPTETKVGLAMVMDEAGNYIKIAADEIEAWAKPFLASAEEFASDISSGVTSVVMDEKKRPILLVGLAAVFMIFLTSLTGKRKANA